MYVEKSVNDKKETQLSIRKNDVSPSLTIPTTGAYTSAYAELVNNINDIKANKIHFCFLLPDISYNYP